MDGFTYPNEVNIQWDLLIVIYPYITGLVAGAFIVSSLYHVFGIAQLKPVARLSLLVAWTFLAVCPLPLILHLGRPERAFEMFLTPNFTSAMSGFGFIWFGYFILLTVETWLVFRKDIVGYYMRAKDGIKKTLYSVLALGVYDVSEKTLAKDHKIIKVLAAIGIPTAILLHGYVGFIFGAVKGEPWWATPLMPIIFILSAVVSGIALLTISYVVITKIRKATLDHDCLHTMILWLGGFLTVAITLESLEVLSMLYMSEDSWEIISELIGQKIGVSYLGIQFALGSLLPLLVLATIAMVKLNRRNKTILASVASVAILVGVFAMRWNVVIGGQLVSKSLRGFTSYSPTLLGREGILVAAGLMLLPFVLFAVISYFVPPWQSEIETTAMASEKGRVIYGKPAHTH